MFDNYACCAWASIKYVTALLLTLAVIENSGDASAAEACTMLGISRKDYQGGWAIVRDQVDTRLTAGNQVLLRVVSGYYFSITNETRPVCSIWAPEALQLCSSCMKIFGMDRVEKQVEPYPSPRVLDQYLQGVEGTAQEGCHLCHLFLEGCAKIASGYWKVGHNDGLAFAVYYPVPGTQSTEYLTKSLFIQSEKGLLFQVLSTIAKPMRFKNGGQIPHSQILDLAVQ